MSNKRMFTHEIIKTDSFIEMPTSTQCLYFHLCMRADDDGFVSNPLAIQREVKCSVEDLRILLEKRYIIAFDETGVIVIKHWKIHNTIRKDRYTPTRYQDEIALLVLKEDKSYTELKNHPELADNKPNITINDDWIMKSQEIWEKTFAQYPKKYAEDKARIEWEKLICATSDIERRLEMTRSVYKAIRLYMADYKENYPDDTTFKYVPRFDRWLIDHLPVWEKRVREANDNG